MDCAKKRLVISFTITAAIATLGLGVLEIAARSKLNYRKWTWQLKMKPDWPHVSTMQWNSKFVADNPEFFKEWGAELKTFERNIPVPRYYFQPGLKLQQDGPGWKPATQKAEVFWSSNSDGFRNKPITAKAPETIRIVCLGESTTEGNASSDENHYPAKLEAFLSARYNPRKVEVINAGFSASSIEDHIAILREKIYAMEPDLIVYYATNIIGLPEHFLRNTCTEKNIHPCWLHDKPKLYRSLWNRSALFQILYLPFARTLPPPLPYTVSFEGTDRSWTRIRNLFIELGADVRSHHVPLAMVSFASIARPDLLIHPDSYLQTILRDLYPLNPGDIYRIYQTYNRQIERAAKETGAAFLNIEGKIPANTDIFPWDLIHLADTGNEMLAEAIGTELLKKNLVRPSLPRPVTHGV